MKYVTALKNHNHKITGERVITRGTFYLVHRETKDAYYILNDNDKKMPLNKELFLEGMHDLK